MKRCVSCSMDAATRCLCGYIRIQIDNEWKKRIRYKGILNCWFEFSSLSTLGSGEFRHCAPDCLENMNKKHAFFSCARNEVHTTPPCLVQETTTTSKLNVTERKSFIACGFTLFSKVQEKVNVHFFAFWEKKNKGVFLDLSFPLCLTWDKECSSGKHLHLNFPVLHELKFTTPSFFESNGEKKRPTV